MKKPGIIGKFALVAALAGSTFAFAARQPSTGLAPCVWEEERDNQVTASLLGGTFNHAADPDWQYKFPPGATPAAVEKTLVANGYEKFFDPLHDGTNYMKPINGRWYHYVVHDDGRMESHWEKSRPASLAHMSEFWTSWERPPESACKPPKP
ncbi:MAG: hypothetical protein ACAH83_09665 [Alphaproteobacteria bacterium]